MVFVVETSFLVRKMLLFKKYISCAHILMHYIMVSTKSSKPDLKLSSHFCGKKKYFPIHEQQLNSAAVTVYQIPVNCLPKSQ